MGKEQATPPPSSSSGLYGGGERGAGGKFRKPPARRPPTTPYDRPAANQSQAPLDGGWALSKLLDPACRLIAGGATRFFPSLFSKSPFSAASTTEDEDNVGKEVKEGASGDDAGCTSNLGISEFSGGTNPREGADSLNGSSDFEQLGKDKISNLHDSTEFSKIEQLVKGISLSRDDINRLTEILNSRVADISNVEPKEKKPNMAIKIEGDGAMFARADPRMSTKKEQEGLNRARVGTPLPLVQSAVREEVGASPVDVARAFMGSRVSEVGTDSKRPMSKDERILLQSDGFASEPLIPSPSPKSSMCWPGAMVQDQHAYSTPQSLSSRNGLHYFQRTPYSRTIYSKSKPKLTHSQADKNRYLNILSTPRLQPRTPLYGQSKGDDVLNDYNGSVGPIRRLRHKFLSEVPPRGSISFNLPQNVPSQAENSKGFLPAIKKNLEAGATSASTEFPSVDNTMSSSEVCTPTLHTSNPAVRAILEHLDRNKPTLKEKSAELQLATAYKKSSSSKVIDAMQKGGPSLLHLEGFDFHKNTNFVDKESSAQGNGRGNSNFEVKPQERSTSEATDVNKDIEASSTVNGSHDSQIKFTHEATSLEFTDSRKKGMSELWPPHNQINGQRVTNMVPNSAGSELPKKPPFHPSGTKPILASISIDKPALRQTVFSENSIGFTFPVSVSSGALSEPPTPSIMPSTLASGGVPQSKDGPEIPSYSFGTKRSTPALVFSFPSTSTSSMQDGASNLKFSFGSDKNRLSFSSVGKDGICY